MTEAAGLSPCLGGKELSLEPPKLDAGTVQNWPIIHSQGEHGVDLS